MLATPLGVQCNLWHFYLCLIRLLLHLLQHCQSFSSSCKMQAFLFLPYLCVPFTSTCRELDTTTNNNNKTLMDSQRVPILAKFNPDCHVIALRFLKYTSEVHLWVGLGVSRRWSWWLYGAWLLSGSYSVLGFLNAWGWATFVCDAFLTWQLTDRGSEPQKSRARIKPFSLNCLHQMFCFSSDKVTNKMSIFPLPPHEMEMSTI